MKAEEFLEEIMKGSAKGSMLATIAYDEVADRLVVALGGESVR